MTDTDRQILCCIAHKLRMFCVVAGVRFEEEAFPDSKFTLVNSGVPEKAGRTRMPFPVRKTIDVVLWLSSRPVHTPAVVRTCDGGVGVGLEFTGLDDYTQLRWQQSIEEIAAESAPFGRWLRVFTPDFSESSKPWRLQLLARA